MFASNSCRVLPYVYSGVRLNAQPRTLGLCWWTPFTGFLFGKLGLLIKLTFETRVPGRTSEGFCASWGAALELLLRVATPIYPQV